MSTGYPDLPEFDDPSRPDLTGSAKSAETRRKHAWQSVFFAYMRHPPKGIPDPVAIASFPEMQRLPENVLRHLAMGVAQERTVAEIGESLGVTDEVVAHYVQPAHWSQSFRDILETSVRIRAGSSIQHAVFMGQLLESAQNAYKRVVEQEDDPALAYKAAKDVMAHHGNILHSDTQKQAAGGAQTNAQFNFYTQPQVQGAMKEAIDMVSESAREMKSLMPGVLDITNSPFVSSSSAGDNIETVDILESVPKQSPTTEASEGISLTPAPEE